MCTAENRSIVKDGGCDPERLIQTLNEHRDVSMWWQQRRKVKQLREDKH